MSARRYDVLIIGGFGHVGLPLGIMLAHANLQVGLYDINEQKRASIEAGEMPFLEHDAEPILKQVIRKTLHVAPALEEICQAKTLIITIGTPVDEYLNPKMKPIMELAQQMVRFLRSGHQVILRSTVYPGTSRYLSDFFKKHSLEIPVAFCPERIAQGYAIRELPKLPQIVSGFTESAVQNAEELFGRLGAETIRLSVQEAELAKLFSNASRYIQFAIANQFYMIATESGADPERIYHAMTYKYTRAKDLPTPGFAAGPCLLKDTLQLAAFYRNHFQLGYAAMSINEGLPNFVVERLKIQLGSDLHGVRVGILGMAFKADTDDIRDSLSYKLVKILRFHGAEVLCSDEHVQDPTFVSKEKLLTDCRAIIVGVPHSAYKGIVLPTNVEFIDLWGVLRSPEPEKITPDTIAATASKE